MADCFTPLQRWLNLRKIFHFGSNLQKKETKSLFLSMFIAQDALSWPLVFGDLIQSEKLSEIKFGKRTKSTIGGTACKALNIPHDRFARQLTSESILFPK